MFPPLAVLSRGLFLPAAVHLRLSARFGAVRASSPFYENVTIQKISNMYIHSHV